MKKIFAVILTVVMMATLFVGCNGSDGSSSKTKKVAIIQQVENGAFNDMREGIIKGLKAKGYISGDKDVDYQCADGDETNLNTITQSVANGDYDAVFTVATPATQSMVNQESDIPVFFCAVSAPVAAGVIKDMDKPDMNATGTSNAIPVSDIIDMGYKITPDVKKWGFIYSTSQINAVNTVESAQKYLDKKGVKYESATVETSADVKSSTETLIKKGCDVIFVPNDAIVQDGVSALAQVCNEAKIPTYCSSATTVNSGCLATLAIDDKGIGVKTADKCIEYMKGTKIEKIPAEVVGIDYCTFNSGTADMLGVKAPDKNTIGYEIQVVNK